MLRYLVAFVAAVALVALVTRAPAARRALVAILGLVLLYAVLKLTGVVDALAPEPDWGILIPQSQPADFRRINLRHRD